MLGSFWIWHFIFSSICSNHFSDYQTMNEAANQSPEPTAVAAAVAVHVAGRRRPSFGRWAAHYTITTI
jgi:hypothetical protein